MTRALGWLAVLGLVAGLAAGFGYAPREAVQGNVQRIMYLHVPAVLTAYLAFGLVLLGSIGYLATRRAGWDRLAAAAGEIGVLFTGLTIASGSIWGKPTWGTWWTWDARLTSTAVLFLRLRGLPAAAQPDRGSGGAGPLRGGGRHRGRGQHPDRALLGEVVADAAPALHDPGPRAVPDRSRDRPRRSSSTGWPSPCCSPTSCRAGWRSPGSRSRPDAVQLGLRLRRLRHRRRRAARPTGATWRAGPARSPRAGPRRRGAA